MAFTTGILLFLTGFAIGALVIWVIRQKEVDMIRSNRDQLKSVFGELSRDALDQNQKTFLDLAKSRFDSLVATSDSKLEEKKKLIDASLKEMKSNLEALSKQTIELTGQMVESRQGIHQLSDQTAKLGQILSSSQSRGQWGEKMVEDILDFMGLMEGVNYEKQAQEGTGRPDFTFKLPQGLRINMDVKFPWSHYASLLEAGSEEEADREKKQFLSDVKNHVKTIADREYIDPAGGTVNYVLMFIPNEGIYTYLNKEGGDVVDFALSKKVILCSPITLYAVLSMIRQSVDNFNMETRASEMQSLVQSFKGQWLKFLEKLELLGKSLGTAQKHYEALQATRSRQLEKPMDQILDLQLGSAESEELED